MENIMSSSLIQNLSILASVIFIIAFVIIAIRLLYKYKILILISTAIFVIAYFTIINNLNSDVIQNLSISSSILSIILSTIAISVITNFNGNCDKKLKDIKNTSDSITNEEAISIYSVITDLDNAQKAANEATIKYETTANKLTLAIEQMNIKIDSLNNKLAENK